MNEVKENSCPDCGGADRQPHQNECDVERCSTCGQQRITCECSDDGAVAETFEAIRRHPQDAQFDLLFATGIRNCFDGFDVARDLKQNARLWDGFIFGRFDDDPAITLRDIKHGDWNADTLLILAKDHAPEPAHLLDFVAPIYDSGELDDLWELAAGWCPAELEWVPAERTALMLGASEKHKLLRVWWA